MRTMDDDYAELSLLVGFFAAAADASLGRLHFVPKTQAECWDLTREKLAAWQVEAVAMGVPAEVLEPTEPTRQAISAYVTLGKKIGKRHYGVH